MTVLANMFRRNWGLKVIALVLALLIYYLMHSGSAGSERVRQHKTVGPSKASEIQGIIEVPQNIFKKGSSDGGSGK